MKFPDGVLGCRFAYQMGGLTTTTDTEEVTCGFCQNTLVGEKAPAASKAEVRSLRLETYASRVPEAKAGRCPRCDTRLVSQWGETSCLTCGYADYS